MGGRGSEDFRNFGTPKKLQKKNRAPKNLGKKSCPQILIEKFVDPKKIWKKDFGAPKIPEKKVSGPQRSRKKKLLAYPKSPLIKM